MKEEKQLQKGTLELSKRGDMYPLTIKIMAILVNSKIFKATSPLKFIHKFLLMDINKISRLIWFREKNTLNLRFRVINIPIQRL